MQGGRREKEPRNTGRVGGGEGKRIVNTRGSYLVAWCASMYLFDHDRAEKITPTIDPVSVAHYYALHFEAHYLLFFGLKLNERQSGRHTFQPEA